MLSFNSPEDLFKCLVCEQKTLFQALQVAADQILIGIEDITDTNIYLNPAFVKLYSYTLEELQTAGVLGVIFQDFREDTKLLSTVQSSKSWSQDKQLTHLPSIQTAVKQMNEMLNDVLLIGKLEAGKLEFRPKSLDLVAYCCHLVKRNQLNFSNKLVSCCTNKYDSM